MLVNLDREDNLTIALPPPVLGLASRSSRPRGLRYRLTDAFFGLRAIGHPSPRPSAPTAFLEGRLDRVTPGQPVPVVLGAEAAEVIKVKNVREPWAAIG